jgi:hypothetical protein
VHGISQDVVHPIRQPTDVLLLERIRDRSAELDAASTLPDKPDIRGG